MNAELLEVNKVKKAVDYLRFRYNKKPCKYWLNKWQKKYVEYINLTEKKI